MPAHACTCSQMHARANLCKHMHARVLAVVISSGSGRHPAAVLIRRQKIAALVQLVEVRHSSRRQLIGRPGAAGGGPALIPPVSDPLPNIRGIWRAVAGLNAAALVIACLPL